MYLHNQWSDGVDTLQFCSTGEYFETVEYELHRHLVLEIDNDDSQFSKFHHISMPASGTNLSRNLGRVANFGRIDHQKIKVGLPSNFFAVQVHVIARS